MKFGTIIILCGIMMAGDLPGFSAARPGAANPSAPLERGLFMLEGGIDLASGSGLYVQPRCGIMENLEVYSVIPIPEDEDLTLKSLSAGMAFRLSDGSGITPESSLYLQFDNFADSDLSEYNFFIPFSIEKIGGQFGILDVSGNLGISYALSHGHSFSGNLGAFIEIYGSGSIDKLGSMGHSIDSGVTFMLHENLQIDMNIGTAITDTGDDLFLTVGLAYLFIPENKN